MKDKNGLKFLNANGDFTLDEANKYSYLYFPLCNEEGMLSSITPSLNGDAKTSQNSFLLAPVSSEDLHNNRSSRNFWLYIDGYGPWSASGCSGKQLSLRYTDEEEPVSVEAGLLWHKVIRNNPKLGLRSEITNYVPVKNHRVECMKIVISNIGDRKLTITPTAAIPIFGRSADNLRDHRHVTSLLNRVSTNSNGVIVTPTLSFDERGHRRNDTTYFVLGAEGDGTAPIGFFPEIEEFIGEGGNLEWPEAIVKNRPCVISKDHKTEGFEAIGALRFNTKELSPAESLTFLLVMGIGEKETNLKELFSYYSDDAKFDLELAENINFWKNKVNNFGIETSDSYFNNWMKWVTVQPILRRIYGCSFLPHHDYGRGGRGWRDLWQDCLALIIMEPDEVRDNLINNYGGVRIDGSNATIIGSKPGEFIADRNNIARIWMDHGAWPFITTKLYIDQSGDLDFLVQKKEYFKDRLINRCSNSDDEWIPEYGSKLKDSSGNIYMGSILEHIIIQNITPFFNVGEHNNIRLEGGDWNDGLDMARKNGESVAFSALYASNLIELSKLMLKLKELRNIHSVELAEELVVLFDTLSDKINYDSVGEKLTCLNKFYKLCNHNLSGRTVELDIVMLSMDLEAKGHWLMNHIRETEWLKNDEGYGWFNGYYDNNGNRVEGDYNDSSRMILTSQVFPIMGGTATDEQAGKIIESAKKYLKDEDVGGYRLNTNFNEVKLDMGRLFGFAYGHKENGAMFSHMSIMYCNALYKRGFVREAHDVINTIYKHCSDFDKSCIYPGIPEYINEKGRGMYNYLTGSASWLLLTVLNEMYGIKGDLGNLVFEPKLLLEQFNEEGLSKADTIFGGKKIQVIYHNDGKKEYGAYRIDSIHVDNTPVLFKLVHNKAIVDRSILESLSASQNHEILVHLS